MVLHDTQASLQAECQTEGYGPRSTGQRYDHNTVASHIAAGLDGDYDDELECYISARFADSMLEITLEFEDNQKEVYRFIAM